MYVCVYKYIYGEIEGGEGELVYLKWEGLGRRERWEEVDRE